MMRTTRLFWFLGITVVVAMLLAAACGGGDGDGDDATPENGGTPLTEDVPGVTDTEIVLGTHQPLTNTPAAAYAQIASVTEAYFNFINETQNGVHGRKITLVTEDDQYSPSLTVDVVRRLVEQEKVFAILSGLGTATHLQVVDYLLERGVPDMFMSTGAIEWVRDPEARPNVFGAIPNYVAEGIVLGRYIAETYPGQKLGLVFQNDEFGLDGIDGIKRGIGDNLEIVGEESSEPVDPDVDSQMDSLRAAGADVVVVYTLPPQAAAAVSHARSDLDWDVPIVISGVDANEITILLAGGGEIMEGVVSASIFRQAHETDDPGIAAHLDLLRDYADGMGANYLTIYGQYIGELMVEALERAGPNLTRQGLIDAAESITDFQCSVCLFTINMSSTDHDPAQSLILARIDGGKWVNFGDMFDWEGVAVDDLSLDSLETIPSPY